MADPFDPVDSAVEEVAVGLTSRRPSFSDVLSPAQDDAANTQAAVQRGLTSEIPTFGRLTKDVVKGTLTGSAIQWFSMPDAGEPDPTFDEARLKARLEEAAKVLPPEYLDALGGAHSDKHFDILFKRSVSQIDSIKRIADEGYDWQAAAFLANFLDPSALALGAVTGTLGYYGTAGLGASRLAMIARGGVAGAAGNVSIEAAQDALGNPRTADDYLWATGIGLALGGAFGALARIPEASVEASNIARIGREMIEAAEAAKAAPEALPEVPGTTIAPASPEAPVAPPVADTNAAVGRAAQEAADPAQYPTEFSVQKALADEGEAALREKLKKYPQDKLAELAKLNNITAKNADELVDGAIAKFRSRLAAAGNSPEQIEERLKALQKMKEPVATPRVDTQYPTIEKVGAQLDELEAALKPQAASPDISVKLGDVEVGLNLDDAVRAIQGQADDAAEAAQTALRKLDDLPQDLKSTAYIGRYQGASGREYKIMAETAGDVSGEVRILAREGNAPFKALARNLDNYKVAQEEILKIEGMSSQPKAEAPVKVEPLLLDSPAGKLEITPQGKGQFVLRNLEGDAGSPVTVRTISRDELLKLYENLLRRADTMDIEATLPQPQAQSAGAAAAPAVPQFLEDVDWRSVKDADVPTTGVGGAMSFLNKTRFDRTGILGQSKNPITRLLAPVLGRELVGKSDHSLNPFSAMEDMGRIRDDYGLRYYQAYKPAFQEYLQSQNVRIIGRDRARSQFNQEVGLYVANRDPSRQYHPSVVRLGNEMRTLFKELAEDLKNPLRREGLISRPVAGAENLEANQTYLWRKIDHAKVVGAVNTFGASGAGEPAQGVTLMVRNAIRSAQPDIDPELLEKLARGYVRGIHRRAAGLGDEWSLALGESNFTKLRQLLEDDAGLMPDEVDTILDRLGVNKPSAGMENLKVRTFLDESYIERDLPTRDGGVADLAFRDLLENDAEVLFNRYLRRAAGRVALARVRVAHPRGGNLLIDGITSDDEFGTLIKRLREWYGDKAGVIDPKEGDRDAEYLSFIYDRIRGVPYDPQTTPLAQHLRRIRSFMSMRLMGQVGIAQFGETGNMIGQLGLRSTMAHVPGFRRIINAAGNTTLKDDLFAELEGIAVGPGRLHGFSYQNYDDVADLPFQVPRHASPSMQRLDWALERGERGTYELSGMTVIQQQQQLAVVAGMLEKIAKMDPARLGNANRKRLANLGLDEKMLGRILKQIDRHVDKTDSLLWGKKIKRLNLQNWDDLPARARLEDALYRAAHKIIQSNDPSSAAMWMSEPVWQTVFQFRSYTFTAYANQFLYNIHMGDPQALMSMAWSMGWNAAVRGAQVQMQALGRSDAEKFKEKHLSTWELAKAGFQRSGWSSIIPMVIDTANTLTGGQGIFDARSTGQPTDAIFGSPAGSFVSQFAKFTRGVREGIVDGRAMSQGEARAGFGLLPFSNLPPMAIGFGHLIQGLPERAPPRQIER